uniref:Uncharacterized protein n=1 Tax=Anguilla anguilla TaxID=7936 RepID=A0A0E9XKT5_ANGAN
MAISIINMSRVVCRGLRSFPLPRPGVRLRMMSTTAGERNNTIVESTDEYKYVERLIPPTQVPTPPKHGGPAPSGWSPPSEVPPRSSLYDTSLPHAQRPCLQRHHPWQPDDDSSAQG